MTRATSRHVVVVDYQLGNLFSVVRACELAGLTVDVASTPHEVAKASALILPGVGAFGDAMTNLKKLDLAGPIKDFVSSGAPFMGICLGMQLLMTESEEFGTHQGLDVIPGQVRKFPSPVSQEPIARTFKVPQVGWNSIGSPGSTHDGGPRWSSTPLAQIPQGSNMYFVHSFFVVPTSKTAVLSETTYGGTKYCSSLALNNVFACQFHPEKSGPLGLKIYKTFAESVPERRGTKG